MKKIILCLIFSLSTIFLIAQSDFKQYNILNGQNINPVSYRLFPTQNMWTFLKLNTRNGQIWQVQFDIKGENRFETDLNFKHLVTKEEEFNDRFSLYSTQNMYTFILIDQLDGRMWQVQWSIEPEKRFIIYIK